MLGFSLFQGNPKTETGWDRSRGYPKKSQACRATGVSWFAGRDEWIYVPGAPRKASRTHGIPWFLYVFGKTNSQKQVFFWMKPGF